MPSSQHDVTQLLQQLREGNQDAVSRLVPLLYDELRRLAGGYIGHERRDHTLQATALVHEAYLRLVNQPGIQWQNRAHFLGVAARVMRQILVDYARSHGAAKRGGPQPKASLSDSRVSLDEALVVSDARLASVLDLEQALNRLTAIGPKQARIVELRFYGGLTVEETAEVMGVSEATVKRDWTLARAWLHREMQKNADEKSSSP